MNIYYSSIEYNYLEKKSKYKVGVVYAFVLAKGVLETIPKFTKAISNVGNIEIKEIIFIDVYKDIPWDTKEDQKKYDQLAQEAAKSNKVIFDVFYRYED